MKCEAVSVYEHQVSRVVLKRWSVGARQRERIGALALDTLEIAYPRISHVGGIEDVLRHTRDR